MREFFRRARLILSLLDARERRRGFILFLLTVAGAAMEAIGVGAILPFLLLISDPAAAMRSRWGQALVGLLGRTDERSLLAFCGVTLLVFFVFKAWFLARLYQWQFRFVFRSHQRTSQRLFRAYLRSPYLRHLQRDVAKVMRNITTDVYSLYTLVLVPAFYVQVETLITIVMLLLLVAIEPLAALLVILGMGSFAFLYLRFLSQRTNAAGKEQHLASTEMLRWVSNGVAGLKELRVLGRENQFLDEHRRWNEKFARAATSLRTHTELPRIGLEVVAVLSMLVVVFVVLVQGRAPRAIVPLLGVFGMAAARIMPSMNRIAYAITSIRFHMPAAEAVVVELGADAEIFAPDAPIEEAKGALAPRTAIEVNGVRFRYPGRDEPVLRDVTVTIPIGSTIAFVGPSGAGKTTIVDVILGLIAPEAGAVLVDGKDIRSHLREWQRAIGYIPQPPFLADDTIRRNVAFGIPDERVDEAKVARAIEAAQLRDFVDSLPSGLDTRIGEGGTRLSGGQRQRVGIARALYDDPPVLILDEATSSLDSVTEAEITRAMMSMKGSKTIIVIAHRLSTVRDCDRLCLLVDGSLVATGTFDELLDHPVFAQMQQLAHV